MLDEKEFLSPYGIRSVSKWHEQHPYVVRVGGKEYQVSYQPAESDSGMFGGNSNWRGPVWFPINVLLIRALFQFHALLRRLVPVECPTGSGRLMTLFEVATEISDRLQRIFLRDETGRRPVFGGTEKFQTDPHWRDCIPFYEYFHGDNGAGLGASHQTGWTALVAVARTDLRDRRCPHRARVRQGRHPSHGTSHNRAHGRRPCRDRTRHDARGAGRRRIGRAPRRRGHRRRGASGGEGPRPLHRRDQRRPDAVGDAARAGRRWTCRGSTSTCCRWTSASPPRVTPIGT